MKTYTNKHSKYVIKNVNCKYIKSRYKTCIYRLMQLVILQIYFNKPLLVIFNFLIPFKAVREMKH